MKINVFSEIGTLKKVLVHRPGKEVERLYPKIFDALLFDDVMYLSEAQKEHDAFTNILRNQGIEVIYLEQEIALVLDQGPHLRQELIKNFIIEAKITDSKIFTKIFEFLNEIKDHLTLVKTLIAGIKKDEIPAIDSQAFQTKMPTSKKCPFWIKPLPNLLFQRDTISCLYQGISIHKMWSSTRRREALFYYFLKKYHIDWKNIPMLYDGKIDNGHIEGGDILVINNTTLLVGLSQRTNFEAIKNLAQKIFSHYSIAKFVIGIVIPKQRSSMHLDTVLTQVDVDKFLVDQDFNNQNHQIFELKRGNQNTGLKFQIIPRTLSIEKLLQQYVHPNPQLIVAGGVDTISGKREQWNDGVNCLVLKPGTVIVYDRNYVTNQLLRQAGVKVFEISASELSRGRGGPRCMTMPLKRELLPQDID